MKRKKSTLRKFKIGRDLLIRSICIILFCVNVFGLPEFNGYADAHTEMQVLEETVEHEAKESVGEQVDETDLPEKFTEELEETVECETKESDDEQVDETDLPEKFTAESEDEKKPDEPLSTEPEKQEQNEAPDIVIPFTLDETPVIGGVILADSANKVAIINEADSTQIGYPNLQAAMQAIGTASGSYTAVFVQDYSLTAADKNAVTANGENAHLTITGTYKNDSDTTISTSLNRVQAADKWICNGDTTFKNITLASYLDIYGNCHKLTIGTGVICKSSSGDVFGGSNTNKTGDADVTILSGRWREIKSGGSSGTMSGSAVMNIGGTAMISSAISAAAGVTGRVTVNVDGSDGATVPSFAASVASDEFNINLNNAKITNYLYLGNANLNIAGVCTVGTSITAGTTSTITIKLSEGASLSNGNNQQFNCPKANLVFGAGSKLICNGTTNKIANIVIEGEGAQLAVKKGEPMTVSGTCTGEHELNVDFVNNAMPGLLDIFLTFTTKTNANKDNYTYPGTNGYDGIVTVDGNVVYFDFVPPEGYIYDWYNTTSFYVGGHDQAQHVDDLKCEFNLKSGTNPMLFRLWSGQLTAKVNGYNNGSAFTNYYQQNRPDFRYTIKVGNNIYRLTGGDTGDFPTQVAPDPVFRGYKKSADGSNLDLVFYLGQNVGIVYLHLRINPESTVMSESWDYVNLSNDEQNIIMSHGGDITYAGIDKSYCISGPGQYIASSFQTPSDPVMFMWVDQPTTSNPAVAGPFGNISRAVLAGTLYADALAQTVVSGATIDTGMGIQWQYSVAAGVTQSASGGTAFGSPGSLQFSGKDITFVNPGKEGSSKTVVHSVLNVSNSEITVTKDNCSMEGLPDGITVTGIPDSLTISAVQTTEYNLTYSIDLSVPPGTYPVDYTITNGTEQYRFTDNITVIRDEVMVTCRVKNEDEAENITAISGIESVATAPVTGAAIYKYYDGKLSWTLNSLNYEIKKITVNGAELTTDELAWAKVNNYLIFDEMLENKDVVIYVGEPEERTVTVSKTAVGGPAGQSFAFTITVKDKNGETLAVGTELHCKGDIITDSGATAPDTIKLTLDADGQTAFSLTDGQILEIMGIPVEGKIQVIEVDVNGYEVTHEVNGTASAAENQKDTGLLDMENLDKVIAFHNTRLYDLTVSKTVEGEFGDKTKDFDFNITVKDKDGNNVTKDFDYKGGVLTGSAYTGVTAPADGTLSISGGTGSFTLRHGQSISIKYLDSNYKIQVIETDPGTSYLTNYVKDGVKTDGRAVSEFTLGEENMTIDYTNTRDSIPTSGISTSRRIWIPVLGIGLIWLWCGISGFRMYRRRKER